MLRAILLAVALAILAVAVILVLWDPMAWPLLCGAALLVLGTVYERFHYRGTPAPLPSGPWEPTSERFLDAESGKPVTVWFNPATGARRYVEAGETPPQR